MIYTTRNISIQGNAATIDEDIFLFKQDKNIELKFSIINNKFTFQSTVQENIIEKSEAAYFKIKLKKPDATPITFPIQSVQDGYIVLKIEQELIDEDIEIGDYTFQVRLYDSDKNSILTIPTINNQIHILKPIFDDTDDLSNNTVDIAQASYAVVTSEGETALEIIDENGNYVKTIWASGDVISAEKLNKVEEGIYQAYQKASVISGLQISQSRPEGARAWVQPTYPSYAQEFYYIDKWTQNVKFVKNSDNTAWVTQENEGTSCNENKIYIGNVKQLKLTNNTSTDLSYFGYFTKKDGSLAYSGSSITANGNAIIYCTINDNYDYENVKLYITSIINSGDITVEAIYE